jgi:VCBS repeat-containing protein
LNAQGGADTLDGGAGVDLMAGGTGDDTYVVDVSSDVVTELVGEGSDTVTSANLSLDLNLYLNVEHLSLTGSADLNLTGDANGNLLTGNAGDNILTGNAGNDVLDGGAGSDTLIGGLGDDTYVVDSTLDTITENLGEGTDTVQSADISLDLNVYTEVENATLLGGNQLDVTGNSGNNVLTGNNGDNTLDGGAGDDTLIGGDGDDTYLLDSIGDSVIEAANQGNDTVVSASINLDLANYANVEHAALTGSSGLSLTGDSNANTLTGNTGNNTLDGGLGHDLLIGGGGDDTLIGGDGDDTYVVDSSTDILIENAAAGTDTVQSADISLDLSLYTNIEHASLLGSSDLNLTGDSNDNVLIGNSGNNTLDGGAGNDTLIGGDGNDTYIVDNSGDVITELPNQGSDTVQSDVMSLDLGSYSNVEHATLTGSANLNLSGDTAANILTGNSGNNTLDGGAGDDTLLGGEGDDTYMVDSSSDVITELANQGLDTVQSATIDLDLGNYADVEQGQLLGNFDLDLTGNSDNNTLLGNSGTNTLSGLAGNDSLDGGTGTDVLIGGEGDDVYTVDDLTDSIVELADQGSDTVQSADLSLDLLNYANVESALLLGSAHLNLTGNTSNNTLTGNSGNNILDGGAGTDTVVYGSAWSSYTVIGDDTYATVTGPDGTDTLINVENLRINGVTVATVDAVNDAPVGVNDANGADVVIESSPTVTGDDAAAGNVLTNDTDADSGLGLGETMVVNSISGGTLGVARVGVYGFLVLNANGSYTYTLDNNDADTAALATGQSVTDSFTYTVADAHGATGTATLNVLIQGSTDNSAPDLTAPTAITFTDTSFNDSFTDAFGTLVATDADSGDTLTYGLTGSTDIGGGQFSLTGAYGTLTLDSATGDYTFIANDAALEALTGAASDTFTVTVSDGTDSDSDTLSVNIVQDGTTESNSADSLSGTAGADSFAGLDGNDTYLISSGDSILEADGEGTDSVQSDADYILDANLENLTLTGRASNGTGNGLDNVLTGNSNNNTLSGGAGNDTLNGGLGTDTLLGGTGDDTYVVDALDKLTELAGEGVDTVQSNVAWTLGANLDNLLLTGTGHIAGTGNSLDNVLTGNNGFNTLNGGTGHDTLNGMLGNDTLNGGDGNDTLSGGLGNDILNGGLGNDTYQMMRGQGTDTITDVEASANTDVLWFNDVSISSDQLWFRQTGADLEVAVIGTTTKALVKNWFGSAANQIEEIKAGDGLVLLNTEVQNLVSAMAAFSTRPAGSTSLTVPEQAALTGVLAANWS